MAEKDIKKLSDDELENFAGGDGQGKAQSSG